MNLTPLGWYTKLGRFFHSIQPRLHRPGGEFSTPEIYEPELTKAPTDIQIRQSDFIFPETDIEDLNSQNHNMTAVFIVSGARDTVLPPSPGEDLPRDWHYGSLVGEIIAEERAHFEGIIAALNTQLSQI